MPVKASATLVNAGGMQCTGLFKYSAQNTATVQGKSLGYNINSKEIVYNYANPSV
jgi:hypothetical protein